MIGALYSALMVSTALYTGVVANAYVGQGGTGRAQILAALAAADCVAMSFSDNTMKIVDSVTPANNFDGAAISGGVFNKFTYTRASTATFVGSNGLIQTAASGVPRIDYDPTSLALLGYRHEGARTNLCKQSEDQTTTWGSFNATATANSIASPDGTTTADTITETATTTVQSRYMALTGLLSTGTNYTLSAFFKAGTQQYGVLSMDFGASTIWIRGTYDLNGGTSVSSAGAGGGTVVSIGMIAYPNGWYRCTLTGSLPSGIGQEMMVGMSDVSNPTTTNQYGAVSYVGASKTIYVWGTQIEAGAYATSYIPTTTVSVTRATDALSLPNTGFNLSTSEGTLYSATTSVYNNGTPDRNFMHLANTTTVYHKIAVNNSTGNVEFYGSDTTLQYDIVGSNPTNGVLTKCAAGLAANDFVLVQNAVVKGTDVSGTVGAPTSLRIGEGTPGTEAANAAFYECMYVALRLSNAELQALTT